MCLCFRQSGKQAAAVTKVRLSAFRLPSNEGRSTKSPTRAAARGREALGCLKFEFGKSCNILCVIRGLDPRIHHSSQSLSKEMDCRVKPGMTTSFPGAMRHRSAASQNRDRAERGVVTAPALQRTAPQGYALRCVRGTYRGAFAGRRTSWPCFPHTPDLICASAATRPRAWRVQFPALSCKDACRTFRSPFIRFRNQEVHDGQPHAVLHRWRLGRSRRQEVHARRQSGYGRGDV